LRKRGIHRSRANLNGNDRVEETTCRLEWLEEMVLVWEHAEDVGLDAKADTTMDVFLLRLEPSIGLRLNGSCEWIK
jgi:hypothetical protein